MKVKMRRLPSLTGHLHLRLEEAGTVQVRGRINYQPYVTCGRCLEPSQINIEQEIAVRFRPMFEGELECRDRELALADLDDYFIAEDAVDLETLVNDTVQTAVPTHPTCKAMSGSPCKDLPEESTLTEETTIQVYGKSPRQGAEGNVLPFAALKNFKPKH